MELNTWQSWGLLSGDELDPVKLFPLKSYKERALTSQAVRALYQDTFLILYSEDI